VNGARDAVLELDVDLGDGQVFNIQLRAYSRKIITVISGVILKISLG